MSLPTGKVIAGAALLAVSGIASASDAVLSNVTGPALVNQGDAYVTATPQTELSTGDRLMVLEGGSAEVTYADGCIHTLTDSEVLTIGKQSTCADEQAAAEDTGPSFAAAMGAAPIAGAFVIGGTGVGILAGAASTDSNGKGGISP